MAQKREHIQEANFWGIFWIPLCGVAVNIPPFPAWASLFVSHICIKVSLASAEFCAHREWACTHEPWANPSFPPCRKSYMGPER